MSMLVTIGQRPQSLELVDLLLACHARIRRFTVLALELGRLVDVPSDEVVEACQRCERYFGEALPLHVEDEEQRVLPRLIGRRSDVDRALAVMQCQHRQHQQLLAELLGALQALRVAPWGAQERANLQAAAAQLAPELEEHLSAEEQIIFPAVRTFVPADVQLTAVGELRSRRRSAGHERFPASLPPLL